MEPGLKETPEEIWDVRELGRRRFFEKCSLGLGIRNPSIFHDRLE